MALVLFKWKDPFSSDVYTIPESYCELVTYLMFSLLFKPVWVHIPVRFDLIHVPVIRDSQTCACI